jgi:hypothetical protein
MAARAGGGALVLDRVELFQVGQGRQVGRIVREGRVETGARARQVAARHGNAALEVLDRRTVALLRHLEHGLLRLVGQVRAQVGHHQHFPGAGRIAVEAGRALQFGHGAQACAK